jgi:hypothetical protein
MRSTPIRAALAAAALTTACSQAKPANTAIICQVTVLDTAGATVAMLLDTVTVNVFTTTGAAVTLADSVTGDPRPCRVVSRAGGYTVLNAKDSATGNPTP